MCSCTLTYNDYIILDMLYIKLLWYFFSHNYQICGVLNIFCQNIYGQSNNSINFNFSQQQHLQTPNSCYPNTVKTEKHSNIRGQPIVVR